MTAWGVTETSLDKVIGGATVQPNGIIHSCQDQLNRIYRGQGLNPGGIQSPRGRGNGATAGGRGFAREEGGLPVN